MFGFNGWRRSLRQTLTLFVCLVLLGSAIAQACNVPVFRFALERWRPDMYRITMFHRGQLAEADKKFVDSLEEQQGKPQGNFILRTVDLDALNGAGDDAAADQALFATQNNPPLPWLTVQYPEHLGIPAPIWAGPFKQESISALATSPVRKELIRRLADGQTAVWLLLESGDVERDNAAVALVEEEIKKLAKELKLPELTDSPDDTLLAGVPLRVEFSLLRVARNDPKEEALVKSLIHSESDLIERDDPMVFPVFGRGRALFALIGQGITADNIRGSASFLAGACSCEVKELNPGFDLLLATDWDEMFTREDAAPPVIASREIKLPATGQLVAIPPGSKREDTEEAIATPHDMPSETADGTKSLVFSCTAAASALILVVLLAKARRRSTV